MEAKKVFQMEAQFQYKQHRSQTRQKTITKFYTLTSLNQWLYDALEITSESLTDPHLRFCFKWKRQHDFVKYRLLRSGQQDKPRWDEKTKKNWV